MKLCPRCGDEFLDRVEGCPDCGVELRPEAEMPVLAEGAKRVGVRSGSRRAMRRAAAALQAAGIATRVVEESAELGIPILMDSLVLRFDGWTYVLYVPPEEAARAESICRRVLDGEEIVPSVETDGRCPACGAEVDEVARACPSCALSLEGLAPSRADRTG